jgi:sigma-B regulation protein RsbU (phosphoserine phosphatase)
MSAALLMAGVQARVRATAVTEVPPSTLCAAVNRELCLRMVGNRFVTFYYALYDAACRRLTYANAGHNPPLLIRRCGDVQQLTHGGPVLGILSDAVSGEGQVTLESGDRLVMFTDGISEIRNASGVELGDEGVAGVAVAHRHLGARELMTAIVSHVREFSSNRFEDDATVIVLAAT